MGVLFVPQSSFDATLLSFSPQFLCPVVSFMIFCDAHGSKWELKKSFFLLLSVAHLLFFFVAAAAAFNDFLKYCYDGKQ